MGQYVVHLSNKRFVPVSFEGIIAGDHLIHNDAETVPIHTAIVLFVPDDFGCQVLGRPTKRLSHASAALLIHPIFAQPKIRQLTVTLRVNQYILRLQITVDDALPVQVLESQDDLSAVELSALFFELARDRKMVKKLTAIHELHYHVQVLRVLERKLKLHYERVVQTLQDITFS